MRCLIIGKVWPEPKSSAAGTRTTDIIRSLTAAGWEIHVASAAQKTEFSSDLAAEFGLTTHFIALNHPSFDQWIAALAPDITIFDRYMTEEQYGWRVEKAVPDCLRVLDTSDLHCLREARHVALRSQSSLDLFNAVALREIPCIHRSDLTLMISEFEMQVLQNEFEVKPYQIAYWPFSLASPRQPRPGFSQRDHFVMIGSYLHEPNWDAVRWCREAIWPRIRSACPNAELHIYGSYVSEKARQLHSDSMGFLVRGRADDAIETLSRYRVNLAPLRFGAGLKGKLADAFLAGTPSVATPIAAEAMPGDLPWGSPIADDPQTFAQAAIELHRNREAWTQAQSCGDRIAQTRFARVDWDPKLPELLHAAHRDRHLNRKRNLIGQMLRHHLHRSTEYMSRWIESKNAISQKDKGSELASLNKNRTLD